jgi:hypothetical protein
MAKLKIVRTDGSVLEGEITPAVEYAFEQYAKKGFHKAFRDEEKQSDFNYPDFLILLKEELESS